MTTFAGIHAACGLSNICYGLPGRKFLNQTLMEKEKVNWKLNISTISTLGHQKKN
jgi:hypothetical protein